MLEGMPDDTRVGSACALVGGLAAVAVAIGMGATARRAKAVACVEYPGCVVAHSLQLCKTVERPFSEMMSTEQLRIVVRVMKRRDGIDCLVLVVA